MLPLWLQLNAVFREAEEVAGNIEVTVGTFDFILDGKLSDSEPKLRWKVEEAEWLLGVSIACS